MPKLKISIPHALPKDLALQRIQKFLPELVTQHSDQISDLEESWSGATGTFKFKVSGFKVSGSLTVEDSTVDLSGDLPFLALPFKDKIESTIRIRTEELLK